jgi:hypothetical protein
MVKTCKHDFNTSQEKGYFNLENGHRVSHTQFCRFKCGERRTVPIEAPEKQTSPTIFLNNRDHQK